jgi:hypothetical protein
MAGITDVQKLAGQRDKLLKELVELKSWFAGWGYMRIHLYESFDDAVPSDELAGSGEDVPGLHLLKFEEGDFFDVSEVFVC